MSRHPETIRLYAELNSGRVEWWEQPAVDSPIFLVKLVDHPERWVVNNLGTITAWTNKCPQ